MACCIARRWCEWRAFRLSRWYGFWAVDGNEYSSVELLSCLGTFMCSVLAIRKCSIILFREYLESILQLRSSAKRQRRGYLYSNKRFCGPPLSFKA
jgi:hypothetical protein